MEETPIGVGQQWAYKGEVYIISCYNPGFYLTKDADGANWHNGVEYLGGTNSENVYVRAEPDFRAKFTRVEEEA
jgi:hypothetical protein